MRRTSRSRRGWRPGSGRRGFAGVLCGQAARRVRSPGGRVLAGSGRRSNDAEWAATRPVRSPRPPHHEQAQVLGEKPSRSPREIGPSLAQSRGVSRGRAKGNFAGRTAGFPPLRTSPHCSYRHQGEFFELCARLRQHDQPGPTSRRALPPDEPTVAESYCLADRRRR